MKQKEKHTMSVIARNIKQIRELKDFTQEYMSRELGLSQPAYAKIEQGLIILKIDRLLQIADILDVNISILLNSSNIFNIAFLTEAMQSGYINPQNNTNMIDIDLIRKIIREEIGR